MMRLARLSQSRDDAMRNQRADGSGSGGGVVAGIDRSCAMHNVGRKTSRKSRQRQEDETGRHGGERGSAGLGLFWDGGGRVG